MTAAATEPGRTTRRRGDALLDAIYAAVMEELAEVGYPALSIERVADRARTGKASIYRRWPTRLELVLAAIDHVMPPYDDIPDTGDVREDLLVVLRRIASIMGSRAGAAAKACVDGTDDELARAVRERLLPPRKAMMPCGASHVHGRGGARGGAGHAAPGAAGRRDAAHRRDRPDAAARRAAPARRTDPR